MHYISAILLFCSVVAIFGGKFLIAAILFLGSMIGIWFSRNNKPQEERYRLAGAEALSSNNPQSNTKGSKPHLYRKNPNESATVDSGMGLCPNCGGRVALCSTECIYCRTRFLGDFIPKRIQQNIRMPSFANIGNSPNHVDSISRKLSSYPNGFTETYDINGRSKASRRAARISLNLQNPDLYSSREGRYPLRISEDMILPIDMPIDSNKCFTVLRLFLREMNLYDPIEWDILEEPALKAALREQYAELRQSVKEEEEKLRNYRVSVRDEINEIFEDNPDISKQERRDHKEDAKLEIDEYSSFYKMARIRLSNFRKDKRAWICWYINDSHQSQYYEWIDKEKYGLK